MHISYSGSSKWFKQPLNRSDFVHREEAVAAWIILMQVIIYYVLILEVMSRQGAQQLQLADGVKSIWGEQKSNRRRMRMNKVW